MFLEIPLDTSKPEITSLTDGCLKELDDKFGNKEYKEQLFGAKKSKYTYQPIFRNPSQEDEASKDKHPYIKLKLLTRYPTNEIQTKVIEQKDGAMIPRTDLATIDAFEKFVPLKPKLKSIIAPVKLWIHPATNTDCMYGITFKLVKVLIVLQISKSLQKQKLENGAEFIEDDD